FLLETLLPCEAISRLLADIHDEGWPKACNAGAALVPDAWIDDAERSFLEQRSCQGLRCGVVVRLEAIGKTFVADIVEFSAEIGEVVVVGDFLVEPTGLRQLDRLVDADFGLRSLDLETYIPSAAIGPIE